MLKGRPCLTSLIIPSKTRRPLYLSLHLRCVSDLRMPRIFVGDPTIEEVGSLKKNLELVKLVSFKHLNLLGPSARPYSMFKGQSKDTSDRERVRYSLVKDVEDYQQGIYDKPLPCLGCGIGWFSFLLGFVLPLMWYYATFLYFGNYYRKDPRERAGLAASAIAALGFSLVLLMIVAFFLLQSSQE